MVFLFVLIGLMAIVLLLLRVAIKRLESRKSEPWVASLRVLCRMLFYVLPLAATVYLLFFKYSVPRPILITGGALGIIFLLLVLQFNAAQKKERAAKRATMLSLLRGHVKARKLEKQVKEWNDNYGA